MSLMQAVGREVPTATLVLTVAVWGCAPGSPAPAVTTQCTQDSDCSDLERCDPASGRCALDSNCAANELDLDGDGSVRRGCRVPRRAGHVGDDCDDQDPAIHPGSPERCNERDDDCDGVIDEGFATTPYYLDADHDGWGAAGPGEFDVGTADSCMDAEGLERQTGRRWSTVSGDCDNRDAAVHPGATEACDGRDNDCSGTADDRDEDGDGYGSCLEPGDPHRDCDDRSPVIHPDAVEVCNGVDDDCDGAVDDSATIEFIQDLDGDRYGNPDARTEGCTARDPSWIPAASMVGPDCNDNDHDVHPGADEVCNGRDDDCDVSVDETGAAEVFLEDADGDGYGDAASGTSACSPPGPSWRLRAALAGLDCDDGDALVHPDAVEALADGVDQDCDGRERCYVDADGDGVRTSALVLSSNASCGDPGEAGATAPAGDCDDACAACHPGAPEVAGDEVDEDCDGHELCYQDADGDTYRAAITRASDDLDCGDGGEARAVAGVDCDDARAAIRPGATELPGDRVDQDCDGRELCYLDEDQDRARRASATVMSSDVRCAGPKEALATAAVDCDDEDSTAYPGAPQVCDGVDHDCDGSADDRWCSKGCAGAWPVRLSAGTSPARVAVGDMNQDGRMEIVLSNLLATGVASASGELLWERPDTSKYLRTGAFVDVDAKHETWGERTLEFVSDLDGVLTVFSMAADGTVGTVSVEDTSRLFQGSVTARDLDGDGNPEVFVLGTSSIQVRSWDGAGLALIATVPVPNGSALSSSSGVAVADIDGAERAGRRYPELLIGTGSTSTTNLTRWAGDLFALGIDLSTGLVRNACPGQGGAATSCYETAIAPLIPMQASYPVAHDFDGDGSTDLLARVMYARAREVGTTIENYELTFQAATGTPLGPPTATSPNCLDYDADGDGSVDDCVLHGEWRPSADGDRFLDEVSLAEGRVVLTLWDGRAHRQMASDAREVVGSGSGAIQYAGDLDGDRRLDVLVADTETSALHCVTFGPETYDSLSSFGNPLYFDWRDRTWQVDGLEPNDTWRSAYAPRDESNEYRAYLSSPDDVDWVVLEAPAPELTVRAPMGFGLLVVTHAADGLDEDGDPDPRFHAEVAAGATRTIRFAERDPGVAAGGATPMLVRVSALPGQARVSSPVDFYRMRFELHR